MWWENTADTNNINMGPVLFKYPGKYQDPETEAAKWNPTIADFLTDTCAFFCHVKMSLCERDIFIYRTLFSLLV